MAAHAVAILVVSALAMFVGISPASAVTKLSQSNANAQLTKARITHTASGNCTNRNVRSCTSYSLINQRTVSQAIALRRGSGCAINITGGTETGHARGTYSHWNGYKIDIAKYTCIGRYIKKSFKRIANRGDGYARWRSSAGNIYCDEGNHWDITYY